MIGAWKPLFRDPAWGDGIAHGWQSSFAGVTREQQMNLNNHALVWYLSPTPCATYYWRVLNTIDLKLVHYYVRHTPETHEIGDFLSTGIELPKMHMPMYQKRRVVVNRTLVSSVGSFAYDKRL